MIQHKQFQYRELVGECQGEIVHAETEPNAYFDPENENSTEENLAVTFQLEDNDSSDPVMHTQRFISPLYNKKGLYQQLLDLVEELPDKDSFDEQKLVGKKVVVTMGKNKKGYATVDYVRKLDTPETADEAVEEEKMPEFLKD